MIDTPANQWTAIIAICGAASVFTVQLFTFLGQRKMAAKVETVHTLVNSRLGTLLEDYAKAMRELADLKGSSASIGGAVAATKAAEDHGAEQAQTDSKLGQQKP